MLQEPTPPLLVFLGAPPPPRGSSSPPPSPFWGAASPPPIGSFEKVFKTDHHPQKGTPLGGVIPSHFIRVGVHGSNGGVGPNDPLVRRGTSRESAQRLAKQAEAAEEAGNAQNGVPYGHGVSVTTPGSNARLAKDPADAVSATRRALEDAGFPVRHTPTRSAPNHHTVQRPKPVTEEIADLFNRVFGRKPKGG